MYIKLWLEVIIVTFFDAVATLYALTATNNELYFLHDYYM